MDPMTEELEVQVTRIGRDLELYSKAVDDFGSFDILNVRRTINSFKALIPQIQAWINNAEPTPDPINSRKSYFARVRNILTSNLTRFSPDWAMWARDDYSVTFVEMTKTKILGKSAFSTGARVAFKFHRGNSVGKVLFTCIPESSGTKMNFGVDPRRLVDTVASLLASLRSSVVIADRIQLPCLAKEEFPVKVEVTNMREFSNDWTNSVLNEATIELEDPESPPITPPDANVDSFPGALIDSPGRVAPADVEVEDEVNGFVTHENDDDDFEGNTENGDREVENEGKEDNGKKKTNPVDVKRSDESALLVQDDIGNRGKVSTIKEEKGEVRKEENSKTNGEGLVEERFEDCENVDENVDQKPPVKQYAPKKKMVKKKKKKKPVNQKRKAPFGTRRKEKKPETLIQAKEYVDSTKPDDLVDEELRDKDEEIVGNGATAKDDNDDDIEDKNDEDVETDTDDDYCPKAHFNRRRKRQPETPLEDDPDSLAKKLRKNRAKPDHRGQRCRLCDRVVPKSKAAQHMVEIHNIHEWQCCYCPKTFSSEVHRCKHVKMYHPLRTAKTLAYQPCKDCQLFINEKEAKDHMGIEHDKPNECPFCSFEVGKMNINDTVNVKIQCSAFLTPTQKIKRHVRLLHMLSMKQCSKCGVQFRSKELYNEHRDLSLADSVRTVKACKFVGPSQKVVVCTICGESMLALKMHRHKIKQHLHHQSTTLGFDCPECKKRFPNSEKLNKHLKYHHYPETKIRCQMCDKSFPNEDGVRYHMITHLPPSIKCPLCDKYFKTRDNVIQHVRGCHFPPSLECQECSERFCLGAQASLHVKKKHSLKSSDGAVKRIDVGMGPILDQIPRTKWPSALPS